LTKGEQDYTITKMTSERLIASDLLSFANQQNIVHGILEFDVTDILLAIDAYEKQTGTKISFTAFMINCLGKAVSENKRIQAMKKGRRKIIVFEDVDVAGFVEAERNWKKVPLVYIFRKVNERDLLSINTEMQEVKQQRTKEYKTQNKNLKLYTLVPKFLRNFILKRKYQRDPFFVKK
jgi:pyruvate/2-oxoglutarate dehydrogenase complex dihydrolipoamide acyltransferase (E2) component